MLALNCVLPVLVKSPKGRVLVVAEMLQGPATGASAHGASMSVLIRGSDGVRRSEVKGDTPHRLLNKMDLFLLRKSRSKSLWFTAFFFLLGFKLKYTNRKGWRVDLPVKSPCDLARTQV